MKTVSANAKGSWRTTVATVACFLGVAAMSVPEDAFGRGGRGGGGMMARSSISGGGMNRAGGMNRSRGSMNRQGASAGNRMSSRPSSRPSSSNRMAGSGNRASAGDRMSNSGNRVQGGDRWQGGNRENYGNTGSGNNNRVNTGDINIDRGDWNIDVDGDNWDLGDNIGSGGLIAAGIVGATVGAVVAGSYYRYLPTGCPLVHTYAVPYYYCGGVYYSQRLDGDEVIYVVVEP